MSEEKRLRVRRGCNAQREALLRSLREPRLQPGPECPGRAALPGSQSVTETGLELGPPNQPTQVGAAAVQLPQLNLTGLEPHRPWARRPELPQNVLSQFREAVL